MRASHVPHPMRTRLADVAARAGVSTAAASMALRDSPRISAATRARVQAAARALNYHPDAAAQTLARSSQNAGQSTFYGTLGIITMSGWDDGLHAAWQPNASPHAWQRALPEAAASFGYATNSFHFPRNAAECARLLRRLNARNIRGLIVEAANRPIPEVGFRWNRFATVVISPPPGELPFHRINSHSITETFSAVKRCHALGYRRPGLIVNDPLFADWRGGFDAACALLNLKKSASVLSLPDWNETAFLRWFRRRRPDVIIANQDDLPLTALARDGLLAPRDFGYCCLDLPPDSGALSGFRQLRLVRNRLAVELLHGFLRRGEFGQPEAPLAVEVAHRWVDGKTLRTVPSV